MLTLWSKINLPSLDFHPWKKFHTYQSKDLRPELMRQITLKIIIHIAPFYQQYHQPHRKRKTL